MFQKAYGHVEPWIEGIRKANAEKQAFIAAKVELRVVVRGQSLTRTDLESKVEELTRLKRGEESLNKQL